MHGNRGGGGQPHRRCYRRAGLLVDRGCDLPGHMAPRMKLGRPVLARLFVVFALIYFAASILLKGRP
ncbi:hypothetical protein D3C86_1871370 [compost metagenome]